MNNPDSRVYLGFFLGVKQTIEFYHLTPPKGRKFYHSRESYKKTPDCLYFRRHFFGNEALNRKILLLHSLGMFDRNHEAYFSYWFIKARVNREYPPKTLDLVELKHFKIGIYCVGVMNALAFMVLMIEIIGNKAMKRSMNTKTNIIVLTESRK